MTAVLAVLRGQPGIAGGDAIGANVTLLTLVLGGLALAAPLALGRRGAQYATAAAVAGAAAWVTLLDDVVGRGEGAALVALYAAVVAAIWWREREVPAFGELAEILAEDAEGSGEVDEAPSSRALLLVLLGVVVMGAGGWFAVAGAERLVARFGIEGSVVGLTVVALATTSEFVALVPGGDPARDPGAGGSRDRRVGHLQRHRDPRGRRPRRPARGARTDRLRAPRRRAGPAARRRRVAAGRPRTCARQRAAARLRRPRHLALALTGRSVPAGPGRPTLGAHGGAGR